MVHGSDFVDLPGKRSLREWAQFGDWLMCGAFIAYEQQTGAASGPMVQLCRDVHQQLKAALAAAEPEDALKLFKEDYSALVPAAKLAMPNLLIRMSAAAKVAETLTPEQLEAVETMNSWIKDHLECIARGIEVSAAKDPATKQQLFDGLARPATNSKPLAEMSEVELYRADCKDLDGALAWKLHSIGLQAG